MNPVGCCRACVPKMCAYGPQHPPVLLSSPTPSPTVTFFSSICCSCVCLVGPFPLTARPQQQQSYSRATAVVACVFFFVHLADENTSSPVGWRFSTEILPRAAAHTEKNRDRSFATSVGTSLRGRQASRQRLLHA
ncbi:unnamed protein product, partial [Ectocarpus sp. 8 AP-2014]